MEIRQVDAIEHLAPHYDEWMDVLSRSNESSSVFLCPAWLYNWWECFGDGRDLKFLMAYDKERLVGIAPLAVFTRHILGIPVRILKFVGSGHADHLDFCAEDGCRREVIRSLFDYMVRQLSWDVMDLLDIPEDSPNLPILKDLIGEHRISSHIQSSIACPYLPLNGDQWETFYAGKRSKSSRQDLRRRLRRLADGGDVAFRRYEDPDAAGAVFPQLLQVYERRWKNKNLSISFIGEKDRIFYKNMAQCLALEGRLHLLTLELDQKVIAFTLSAVFGTRFTWLITAFDPAYTKFAAGELVLTHLLEDVFQKRAFSEFDFTRGDEAYKYKWTDRQRWNLRVIVQNRGMMRKVPFSAICSFAAFRRKAKESELLRKVKLNLGGQIRQALTSSND